MRALFLPQGDRQPALRSLTEHVAGFNADDYLKLSVGATRMTYSAGEPAELSFFTPFPRHSFEQIVVAPGVRLFQSNWARAFLLSLYHKLRPGGKLIVTTANGPAATANGYLTHAAAKEVLHQSGTLLTAVPPSGLLGGLKGLVKPSAAGPQGQALADFTRGPDLPTVDSVLSWFVERATPSLLTALEVDASGKLPEWAAAWLTGFLLPGSAPPIATPKNEQTTAAGRWSEAVNFAEKVEFLTYLIHGPSYKNAVLNRILADHFGARRDLAVLDHGGGPGFVIAELLLENPSIRRAVNCDINAQYLWPAFDLYLHYFDRLNGRFAFAIGAAQDYAYDQTYDLISFIGSLLYVPRPQTKATLDRAWAALNPGGLLVVHENIKNPAFTRDHDVMFTVEELDGFLSAYGPITHYSSTRCARLSATEVGTSTVFRVVQRR
jgi:SAM-dependent methyltransferase